MIAVTSAAEAVTGGIGAFPTAPNGRLCIAEELVPPQGNRALFESLQAAITGETAMRLALLALHGTACLLAAAPVLAHHAFSTEFDVNRPVTLAGKVTKVELINPHSWIHIDVVGDDGKTVSWMVEGGSPNALVRRGITKNSIPIGSDLVIRGYGTRDGSNKAVGREMTFADGRALFFGGTQTPEEAAKPQ